MGKGRDVLKMAQIFGSRTRILQLSFAKITKDKEQVLGARAWGGRKGTLMSCT